MEIEIGDAIRIVREIVRHSARGTFPHWSRRRHAAIARVLEEAEVIRKWMDRVDHLRDDDLAAVADAAEAVAREIETRAARLTGRASIADAAIAAGEAVAREIKT